MGLYQLNEASLRNIISGDNGLIIHNIELTTGPDGIYDLKYLVQYESVKNIMHTLFIKCIPCTCAVFHT